MSFMPQQPEKIADITEKGWIYFILYMQMLLQCRHLKRHK